jgi:toxin ParE1/3/4
MMYRLSPDAEHDLQTIFDYIAADNPRAAMRMIERLQRSCRLLGEFPRPAPSRDEIRPGLRMHEVHNYLIIYRAVPGGAEVIRVFHRARNWKELL